MSTIYKTLHQGVLIGYTTTYTVPVGTNAIIGSITVVNVSASNSSVLTIWQLPTSSTAVSDAYLMQPAVTLMPGEKFVLKGPKTVGAGTTFEFRATGAGYLNCLIEGGEVAGTEQWWPDGPSASGFLLTSDGAGGSAWVGSQDLLNRYGYVGDAANVGMVVSADTATDRVFFAESSGQSFLSGGVYSVAQLDAIAGTSNWTLRARFYGTNGGTSKTFTGQLSGWNRNGASLTGVVGYGTPQTTATTGIYTKWYLPEVSATRATLLGTSRDVYGPRLWSSVTEATNVSSAGVVVRLTWE